MVSRGAVADNRRSGPRRRPAAPVFLRVSACYDDSCRQARKSRRNRIGTMNDGIKALEQGDEDLLAFEITDEALEAAAEKSKPAFTLIGSPTVSILVACCG